MMSVLSGDLGSILQCAISDDGSRAVEQLRLWSFESFSLKKKEKRGVPVFIDYLLNCVCLLLKARSEEFVLSLGVTPMA